MGSVQAVNPVLSNLLDNLKNFGSPLLSSDKVVSAVKKALPADVVKLSAAASRLANVNALFGIPNASSNFTNLDRIFAALQAPIASQSSASPSLSIGLASYQANSRSSELNTLLGLIG